MSILELKSQIIEEINNADEGLLYEIQNVIEHHSDFEIPEYVMNRVKTAQQQALDGKGIPHEEAMKILSAWKEK